MAGITGWTCCHSKCTWLAWNTGSRDVWLPAQLKEYQYSGTQGMGHQLILQQKKNIVAGFFRKIDFLSDLLKKNHSVFLIFTLFLPVKESQSSWVVFWGYCVWKPRASTDLGLCTILETQGEEYSPGRTNIYLIIREPLKLK